MTRSPFLVLNIADTADDMAVKHAYRAAAKRWHPDLNKNNPVAKTNFQEIQAAYEQIRTADLREKYFRENTKTATKPSASQPRPTWKSHNEERQAENRERSQRSHLDEIFKGFHRANGSTPSANEQIVDISLEEAFLGTTRTLRLGADTVEAKIPPAAYQNQTIIIPKATNHTSSGVKVDLLVHINIKTHPRLKRQGSDLMTQIKVSPFRSILGGEISVEGLNGERVFVKINKNIKDGQEIHVPGYGMNKPGTRARGDLIVTIKIKPYPNNWSNEQQGLLEALDRSFNTFDD